MYLPAYSTVELGKLTTEQSILQLFLYLAYNLCYEEIEEGGGLRRICHTDSDPISRVARNATNDDDTNKSEENMQPTTEPNITMMILIIITVALVFSVTAGLTVSRC